MSKGKNPFKLDTLSQYGYTREKSTDRKKPSSGVQVRAPNLEHRVVQYYAYIPTKPNILAQPNQTPIYLVSPQYSWGIRKVLPKCSIFSKSNLALSFFPFGVLDLALRPSARQSTPSRVVFQNKGKRKIKLNYYRFFIKIFQYFLADKYNFEKIKLKNR